jgi:alpha-galactosidase
MNDAETSWAVLLGAAATPTRASERTSMVLVEDRAGTPRLAWVGPAAPGLDADDIAAAKDEGTSPAGSHSGAARSVPLLPEIAGLWFGRPGLSGYRLRQDGPIGHDWAPRLRVVHTDLTGAAARISLADPDCGLAVRTDIEAVSGGPVRLRHVLTNTGESGYVVNHLDVVVPVDERAAETLDLTGRWAGERSPQRRAIGDGLWLRETRTGRSDFDSPTLLVAGTGGFGFRTGSVWGIHAAWSGNTAHFVQRQPDGTLTLGAGELILPGEIVLAHGESYSTPWVVVVSSDAGLDGLSAQLHDYVRSLPAHPASPRLVIGNVWEAVYFDHDLDRLTQLADRSAEVGVERFVLDDGWFGSRRDDTSGLGDWTVSPEVWPAGLTPLIEHVRGLGMQFGLWFEPEMVNRDSDLYRAHPDWALAVGDRPPLETRNQLVLDLSRDEVRKYLYDSIDAVLTSYQIDFVKWDHNRRLADAGSAARGGAPSFHAQTVAYYQLLDELREAHPGVEWESCASGGGRIDLGVIERVERFWTSDMTDALARQRIQRWTGLLVPPEYLGAHVSAPRNHQTGRRFSLDFRAATAFFGSFGIEWDITTATPAELARLAEWTAAYKRHRALLHSERVFRLDLAQQELSVHGVVAADAGEAIAGYVQLDETEHEPPPLIVPGLDPNRRYRARQILPPTDDHPSSRPWRGEGRSYTGAVIGRVGIPAPERAPETVTVIHLLAE